MELDKRVSKFSSPATAGDERENSGTGEAMADERGEEEEFKYDEADMVEDLETCRRFIEEFHSKYRAGRLDFATADLAADCEVVAGIAHGLASRGIEVKGELEQRAVKVWGLLWSPKGVRYALVVAEMAGLESAIRETLASARAAIELRRNPPIREEDLPF